MFPSTYATLCLGKLGYSRNKGTSIWNFVPNSGLRKFRYSTLTVGKCDINCNSGQTGDYGTSGSDRVMSDMHGTYDMAQTLLVWFIVDLLYSKLYKKLYNKSY